jgi:hypothetical protein
MTQNIPATGSVNFLYHKDFSFINTRHKKHHSFTQKLSFTPVISMWLIYLNIYNKNRNITVGYVNSLTTSPQSAPAALIIVPPYSAFIFLCLEQFCPQIPTTCLYICQSITLMEVQHLATSCIMYNLKLWLTGRKKCGCMRILIGF